MLHITIDQDGKKILCSKGLRNDSGRNALEDDEEEEFSECEDRISVSLDRKSVCETERERIVHKIPVVSIIILGCGEEQEKEALQSVWTSVNMR